MRRTLEIVKQKKTAQHFSRAWIARSKRDETTTHLWQILAKIIKSESQQKTNFPTDRQMNHIEIVDDLAAQRQIFQLHEVLLY